MHLLTRADWDTNGDGVISKREMQRALGALSIPIDRAAIDALFDQLDADQSGGIDYHEFNRLLRREVTIEKDIVEARVIGKSSHVTTDAHDDVGKLRAAGSCTPPALDIPFPFSSSAYESPQERAQLEQALTKPKKRGMKVSRSARTEFNQRMQRYGETHLRELIRGADEHAAEVAGQSINSMLTRSRTDPVLPKVRR
jgi:hypothetical protein